MKKTITALSTLCLAGVVCAQSSVILFGVIDTNYAWGTGSGLASSSKTQLASGSNAPSRWGIRGSADLGGGLAASFWLESQVFADSGSGQPTNTENQPSGATASDAGLTFARRSTAGLAGPFGEVRGGRDSRRTALYSTFARLRNSGRATSALNGATTSPSQPSSGLTWASGTTSERWPT